MAEFRLWGYHHFYFGPMGSKLMYCRIIKGKTKVSMLMNFCFNGFSGIMFPLKPQVRALVLFGPKGALSSCFFLRFRVRHSWKNPHLPSQLKHFQEYFTSGKLIFHLRNVIFTPFRRQGRRILYSRLKVGTKSFSPLHTHSSRDCFWCSFCVHSSQALLRRSCKASHPVHPPLPTSHFPNPKWGGSAISIKALLSFHPQSVGWLVGRSKRKCWETCQLPQFSTFFRFEPSLETCKFVGQQSSNRRSGKIALFPQAVLWWEWQDWSERKSFH